MKGPVTGTRRRNFEWMPPALGAAWTLAALALALPRISVWRTYAAELAQGLSPLPLPAELLYAGAGHIAALGLAAAFILALPGFGRPALSFARITLDDGAERVLVSLAAGWLVLGTAYFGLALAGLFYAPLLLATAAAGLAAGLPALARFRRAAGSGGSRAGFTGAFLPVALPALLCLPFVLVPPTFTDWNYYHAAAPEHFLKMHRMACDGTNTGFLFQLTAELLMAPAIALRLAPLGVLACAVPFVAGLAVAAGRLGRSAGWPAAGLALGFALTLKHSWWVLVTGKNDLAAAGFGLLAILYQASGRRLLPALLWGAFCCVKINGLPFAGLAWLWHESVRWRAAGRRWRPDWPWLALAGAALVPWLAKSWLLRGDPVWPVLSRWIPGALWDWRSGQSLAALVGNETRLSKSLLNPGGLALEYSPALLALAPLVVLRWGALPGFVRSSSLFALACFAAYGLVLRYELERMILPLVLCWCLPAGAAAASLLGEWARPRRSMGLALLAVLAWAPVARTAIEFHNENSVRCMLGTRTPDEFLFETHTTTAETQDDIRRLAGLRTLILMGQPSPYRWPGKVWSEEFLEMKPTWTLTREAPDIRRMLVKLRQRNVTHLALNFVTEVSVSDLQSSYEGFAWDARQLDLLHEFIRDHAELAVVPRHCDQINGGYYVWRVVGRPAKPNRVIPYLPGTQKLFAQLYRPVLTSGNARKSRDLLLEYAARYPDVAVFRMQAGFFSYQLKEWSLAYDQFGPSVRAGVIGDASHIIYGMAANNTGRLEEALEVFREARRIFFRAYGEIDGLESDTLVNLVFKSAETGTGRGRAMEYAHRAVFLRPGSAAARVALGVAHYLAGNMAAAQTMLAREAGLIKDDPRLLAACLAYLGRTTPR